MKRKIVLFVLQVLQKLPGGDNSIYENTALAKAIGDYAEAEGIVSFLERNRDAPPEAINRYLELRFSNLRAMTFRSAEYFLLHWRTLRMLWNEAGVLRQKAKSMSEAEIISEKRRLQNLCAMLGGDGESLTYASEIVAFATPVD